MMIGPAEEAAAPARQAMALTPEAAIMHVCAAWAVAEAGCREEASEILARAGGALEGNVHGELALFLMHALEGHREEAVRIATPEMVETVQNELASRMMATGYALLGCKREAIHCLRTAAELGYFNYPNLRADSRFLECLREEPEFHALMAEVEPRWHAVIDWERRLTV